MEMSFESWLESYPHRREHPQGFYFESDLRAAYEAGAREGEAKYQALAAEVRRIMDHPEDLGRPGGRRDYPAIAAALRETDPPSDRDALSVSGQSLKSEVARYFRDRGWAAEAMEDNGFPAMAAVMREEGSDAAPE
jgi:hypothetical protein